MFFRGNSGSLNPRMVIVQKGTHSLLRTNVQVVQYYPINTFTMLSASEEQPPVTADVIIPFNAIDLLPPGSEPPAGTLGSWSWSFTNRAAAATEWQITLKRHSEYPDYYQDVPFQKLKDVWFYFDAIGQ